MDIREFNVSLTPEEAADLIEEAIVEWSISGTLVDRYQRVIGEKEVLVLVLEKYYARTSNRCSVTVTLDNFEETTQVRAASSGSSEGVFFRFDWGAGADFVDRIEGALRDYQV